MDPLIRRLTHALTRPETVQPALAALRGHTDQAVVEALVELIHRPHTIATKDAIDLLGAIEHPLVEETLIYCLDSPLVKARQAAIEALAWRGCLPADAIFRRLREDPSWTTRRSALQALAGHDETFWLILAAADDPHWRVRHALLGVLTPVQDADRRREIRARLGMRLDSRSQGVLRYLHALWEGDWTPGTSPVPSQAWPGHDLDPAVMLRNLTSLSPATCRTHLSALIGLLAHDDERIGRLAGQIVRRYGAAEDLIEALGWLEDPRSNAGPGLDALLGKLDLDRIEAASRLILHQPNPSPARLAWAIDQVGMAFPFEEEAERCRFLMSNAALPGVVREALEGINPSPQPPPRSGEGEPERSSLVPPLPLEKEVRGLGFAQHPLARAAALTPVQAAEIIAHPEAESSWHVLATAAALCRVPLWHLEPQPAWEPPPSPISPPQPLAVIPAAPPHARLLGPDEIRVAPVGLSGHYRLPVEGFVAGIDAGINVLFWEPNYTTLTAFSTRLPASTRQELHFMAGSFEATPKRVRADAERALRHLKIERLMLFVLFWTRSWDRLDDALRRMLDDLLREGKVQRTMLSTHDRTLAVEAIAGGWNPVMVRHSAAHRGAEEQVFPRAIEAGTSVITFNNTCYGRLLRARGDRPGPTAADCYRFSLAQPGVTMCLSAPANLEQLADTLAVVREPTIMEERRAQLAAWGAELYREEKLFQQTIRSR